LGSVLRLINEQSGTTADNEVLRVLKEKQILAVANHVDLVTRDGREIAVEHSAAPILAGEGKSHRRGAGLPRRGRETAGADRDRRAGCPAIELTQDSVFVIDMEGTSSLLEPRGGGHDGVFSKAQAAGKIAHDLLRTEFPQAARLR
jgi:hypothetical protein